MFWPQASDYREAIQNLRLSFRDSELCGGQATTDARGLPTTWVGNFAAVFHVRGPTPQQDWAVKCFTKDKPGLQERYRQIDAHLQQQRLPFMVRFRYLPDEVQVRGTRYPALKMDWIEGLRLDQFLSNCLNQPNYESTLQMLSDMWVRLAQQLRQAQVAHGDLQHGNVLLVPVPGKEAFNLRLVDYDGICVPGLENVPTHEIGHPAYQHPERLAEGGQGLEIDRFSHLLIYTTLQCLIVGGHTLWERFYDGDRLLLGPLDLMEPETSSVFEHLWKLDGAAARSLVGHLLMAAKKPLADAPLLDAVVADSRVVPLSADQERWIEQWLPKRIAPAPPRFETDTRKDAPSNPASGQGETAVVSETVVILEPAVPLESVVPLEPVALPRAQAEVPGAAPSQPQPFRCPRCHRLTARTDHWAPVPVSFDPFGNLTSAVCRIRQRQTLLFLHLTIDAKPLGRQHSDFRPILTKSGAALVASVPLVVFAIWLVVGLIVGENSLAPTLLLGFLGPLAVTLVWWFYSPAVNSAEDAAWLSVIGDVLLKNPTVQHFDFVAGLARACAARWEELGAANHGLGGGTAEWRKQREVAKNREAIVKRCLDLARSLAGEGRIPHATVAWLYRLHIADQLGVGNRIRQSASLLEQLLTDCLGKRLPWACLDLAIDRPLLLSLLRPELSRWFVVRFCQKCLERGHHPNEIAALAGESAVLSRLLGRISRLIPEAIAFLLTMQKACPGGLAELGLKGATVAEFKLPEQFLRLHQWPDLLALADDDTLVLRTSGFYFRDVRYITMPKITVSHEREGYLLHVGNHSFLYRSHPGDLGGRVVAWSYLYFQKILPRVTQELTAEPSPSRLQDTRSVAMQCPHCQGLFGGVITLPELLLAAETRQPETLAGQRRGYYRRGGDDEHSMATRRGRGGFRGGCAVVDRVSGQGAGASSATALGGAVHGLRAGRTERSGCRRGCRIVVSRKARGAAAVAGASCDGREGASRDRRFPVVRAGGGRRVCGTFDARIGGPQLAADGCPSNAALAVAGAPGAPRATSGHRECDRSEAGADPARRVPDGLRGGRSRAG